MGDLTNSFKNLISLDSYVDKAVRVLIKVEALSSYYPRIRVSSLDPWAYQPVKSDSFQYK